MTQPSTTSHFPPFTPGRPIDLGAVDGTNVGFRPVAVTVELWRAKRHKELLQAWEAGGQQGAKPTKPSFEDGAKAIDPRPPARTAANMIARFAEDNRIKYLVVAVDHPSPSIRKSEYPDYKGNRTIDTSPIVQALVEELDNYRIRWEWVPGYEADDLVAKRARLAAANGRQVAILSSDTDLMCMASDLIRIVRFHPRGFDRSTQLPEERYEWFGPAEVCAKFGVPCPDAIVDYKVLKGEKTDNVEGIPGIGEVKAARLLTDYNDIETLARLKVLKPEHAEKALMLKALLRFRDMPLPDILPSECKAPWFRVAQERRQRLQD